MKTIRVRKATKKQAKDFKDCFRNLKPAEGTLRVWHTPQVPGKPFLVDISPISPHPIADAKQILALLARYDDFQYQNRIKPNYANAQGLEVYEGGQWVEWTNEDGDDIGDIMRREGA